LAPGEQALFRRLAVFVGGWDLEAAEAVTGEPGADVLDGLGALVDQSLIRQEETPDGEPRFAMLETLREYALERMEETGEAEAARGRHLAHFLVLAEAAEPGVRGPEQVE